MLGGSFRLFGARLLGESLGSLEGIDLCLVWILLDHLTRLTGAILKDRHILQIIDMDTRNNEIYA